MDMSTRETRSPAIGEMCETLFFTSRCKWRQYYWLFQNCVSSADATIHDSKATTDLRLALEAITSPTGIKCIRLKRRLYFGISAEHKIRKFCTHHFTIPLNTNCCSIWHRLVADDTSDV